MKNPHSTRRDFLKKSAAAAAVGGAVPYFTWSEKAFANQSANDRPKIGCIGVGSMGSGDARGHASFGDVVAVCDVDSRHAARAKENDRIGKGKADAYGDYRKVIEKDSRGLPARWKYLWQSVGGLGAALVLYLLADQPAATELYVPFFKTSVLEMGAASMVLTYFVIVGSSNAVNLTDGLDGLAIMPTVLVSGALGLIAYLVGHASFANYLLIPHVSGAGELTVFCGSMVGAGLGFLWFNTYPAQIFMGDVGALALGAALGTIAVITRHELVFFIMGGVFVMETVSVIMQVASFKLTGRRIFRMAPLHHHFELKGWPEPRVIVRFWIITVVLVLIGLTTLKLQ